MATDRIINQRELKILLDYNQNTGEFRWKVEKNSRIGVGDIAGCINALGYNRIIIDKKSHAAHRLAWLYVYGKFPNNQIDHINQDRADNRIENLRDVTRVENLRNQRMRRTNTSGTMGVSWNKSNQSWIARIQVDDKREYLGSFKNIRDAIRARAKAKIKYGFHPNHA